MPAYRSPTALAVAAAPNFDIDAFVYSSDTVYVCAPADAQQQLAPFVVTFLDQLKTAVYRPPPGWAPVLYALDEAANIAPLPGLPSVVSEGGSQGLVSLVCLQDLSQARSRWGPAADGFLTLFGWKMLLPGIADYPTLQLVSALAGHHDVLRHARTRSTQWWAQHPTDTITTTNEHRPALPIDQISNLAPGTALVIGPSVPPPTRVRLVSCWSDPWRQHINL